MLYMYVADQSISLSKTPVDHKVHLTSSSLHKNALIFFPYTNTLGQKTFKPDHWKFNV